MIDVNVNLSLWPFRRLPYDSATRLAGKLRENQVVEAWAGSFDAMLHRDVAGVNLRLAQMCRQVTDVRLLPMGTVNPTAPDWGEDLRRCCEEFRMPGIRLLPNYHGYQLDNPAVGDLLAGIESRNALVQIVFRMEDPRTQHPLVQVPDVDATPLPKLVAAYPSLKFILLNWSQTVRGDLFRQLAQAENVSFDIAMQEGVGGVEKLLGMLPLSHVLFGSHFPFFNLESSLFKLRESPLSPAQLQAITYENARKLREGTR